MLVRGTEETVEQGKRALASLLEAHAARTRMVHVESRLLGQVIGPKGATIRALQKDFAVQIDVAGKAAGPEGVAVNVTGEDAAAVERCCARVLELASEGGKRRIGLPEDARRVLVASQNSQRKVRPGPRGGLGSLRLPTAG